MSCEKCGAQINEGAAFCPICGAGVAAPAQPEYTYAAPAAEEVYDEAKDAADNKWFAVAAYILFFIPLVVPAAKDSKFARFHANQGLLVLIVSIAYSVVSSILRAILGAIFPFRWTNVLTYTRGPIYGILSFIIGIASLAAVALAVIGILNAIKGEKKELPIIGNVKIIK